MVAVCSQGQPRELPRSTPATSRDKGNSTEATEHLRRARLRSSSGLMATSRQVFWMFPWVDPRVYENVTKVSLGPQGIMR